tara:strand:- start:17548 stop:18648 length:1101 start_codon:yes stop_codon:yes gene_type:complete
MAADMTSDETYMALAIREAERGLYTARPNPRVGCVLVRDDEIIGKGFHLQTGTAHAEVNAIKAAGGDVAGSTAYVTLEPCSFVGRTPSCADTLIEKGVQRVVFAAQDPHPGNRGKGFDKLRAAGIEVVGPILESSAIALNPGHFKKFKAGLPFVRLKLAQSLDGRTALSNGDSQWITGPEARRDVQRLRARSCAVVTGVDTVIADNPGLNVRSGDIGGEYAELASNIRRPIVVLDSKGRMPQGAKLHQNSNLIVVQTPEHGAGQTTVAANDKGQIDLLQLLQFLVREEDCSEVLFECGATLAGSLIQSGLVDELILYIAPKLMGNSARGLVQLDDILDMGQVPRFSLKDSRQVGEDLRLTLKIAAS